MGRLPYAGWGTIFGGTRVTPDDYRAPAIEPQPLPEAQEVRRKAVVQAFADWTLRDKVGAGTRRTVTYLQDPERVGYTRKTIGHWFPRKRCGDESIWHALCFAAVDYYQLYKPSDEIPSFVLSCTETYRRWRDEDEERARGASTGSDHPLDRLGEIPADQRAAHLDALHDDELLRLRDQHHSDLLLVTEIVRHLVASKHREMLTNTVFGRIVDPGHGFVAAEKIIEWADPVIRRVSALTVRGTAVNDGIRRNCISIIDALTDARRLCSRKSERESEEFALISALRSSDLMITHGFRSEPDVALCIYHNDVTQARMQAGRDAPIEGEVTAIESLLADLTRIDAQAYATYTHALGEEENTATAVEDTSARSKARPKNHFHADRLISVVALIAVHLVIHPDGSTLRNRVEKCAELVLRVHGNAGRHRRDAKNLFNAARAPSASLADPVTALHIVKFSGIGEMLIARILVEMVTDDFLADQDDSEVPEFVELYTGGVQEPDEGRGTLALQRAVGLYDRAITWLSGQGAYGRLRELAKIERDDAEDALKARPKDGEHNDMDEVLKRIKALQTMLTATIVDGLLRADLNSWADVQTSQARTSAVKLMATLNESLRYLKKPELGLRTDVPRGTHERATESEEFPDDLLVDDAV